MSEEMKNIWPGRYPMKIVKEKLEDRIVERVDNRVLVRCGLCAGTGESPWEVSVCRACLGKGAFWIDEPIKVCWLCHATGQQPRTRFKVHCKVCGGKGVIQVPEGKECPLCHGTGHSAIRPASTCGMCKGTGVISEVPAPPVGVGRVEKRRARDRKSSAS